MTYWGTLNPAASTTGTGTSLMGALCSTAVDAGIRISQVQQCVDCYRQYQQNHAAISFCGYSR